MTDFHSMLEGIRKRTQWQCHAIGCPKVCDRGHFFCLKHWSMIGRDLRSKLHGGTPEIREQAIDSAKAFIFKRESRGTDA